MQMNRQEALQRDPYIYAAFWLLRFLGGHHVKSSKRLTRRIRLHSQKVMYRCRQ